MRLEYNVNQLQRSPKSFWPCVRANAKLTRDYFAPLNATIFRTLIAIGVPFVFLTITWNILKNGSENRFTDRSKTATLCAGILAFISLKPSQMEALYPYYVALFLLSAFTWTVSVNGLKAGAQKAAVSVAGLLFLAWIRPDLFRWVLN